MRNASPLPDEGALTEWLQRYFIVAVVPAYRVEKEIEGVLRSMPVFVKRIIVVNDASPDQTGAVVTKIAAADDRILFLNHEVNQGVGGAMVTGFRQALELDAQIVVKVDGDGQMDVSDMPSLLVPLVRGEADYTKGNRFRDFQALSQMPPLRRFGNMLLSFLAKAATGYWNCFDPTNGYVAIRGDVLAQLPMHRIDRTYFFETSMLARLYLMGALVRDVPMKAHYGTETSSLAIRKVLREFPGRLLNCFCKRIILKKFIYDLTIESIYLLCGVPMLLVGVLYGGYNWILYAKSGIGAPTGTVVISAMLIILGFQILLAAVNIDLQSVPREPLCDGPLPECRPPS
jgi:glycosyltransferase involved in cell wall biosynthesis